jgi:alcohol dehydrogenase class IV
MPYWFEDPTLKALAPLALSTSIKGLTTIFNTPKIFVGSNVFPEGLAIGPSTMDALAGRCPKKRALIVTDDFSKRYVKKITPFLENGGFTHDTWPKCLPEAPIENVTQCGEKMRAFEPDLIMALGGGSVMDTAKVAWILYERPDIENVCMVSPLDKLGLRKKAMLAAVPTTAGTGSECTGAAVVHDTAVQRKVALSHDELLPDVAILAPEFTYSMPPELTVGTGLDVLAHVMDAVTAPAAYELTTPLALQAIQMVFRWLPRAYREGQDHEARHRMLLASSIAGIAFGMSGTHLTHALGHSLGAIFELHHGLTVGFFIPHSLQYCSVVTDKHLLTCEALGVGGDGPEEKLANLVAKVRSFLTELDVPLTIKGLGISEPDFEAKLDKLVEYAVGDVSAFLSPRPMTPAQCEKVFRYAYEGKDIDF